MGNCSPPDDGNELVLMAGRTRTEPIPATPLIGLLVNVTMTRLPDLSLLSSSEKDGSDHHIAGAGGSVEAAGGGTEVEGASGLPRPSVARCPVRHRHR